MSARRRHRATEVRRAARDDLAAFYGGDVQAGTGVRSVLHDEARRMGADDLRTRQRIDAAVQAAADRACAPEPFDPDPDYDADLDTVLATLRDGWLGEWDDAVAAILAALVALTGSTTEALRLLRAVHAEAEQAILGTHPALPDADTHPPTQQRVHALVDAARPGPRTVACVQRQPHLI